MDGIANSQSLMICQKALDALWLKQQVIADNIANVDTPNYKSKSVEFEDLLQTALKFSPGEGLGERLQALQPRVVENAGSSIDENGNNVDIDEQNIELTRAELQFQALSRIVSSDLSRLRLAINGGRG